MGDASKRRSLFGRRTSAPERPPDEDEHEGLADRLDAVSHAPTRSPDEVRAAFNRREPTQPLPQDPEPESFAEQFTTDSLFLTADDEPVVDPEDPWYVLGLAPGSTWHAVVAAHRSLARVHHPDHLVDATPEERERAERRMRDINVAYTTLRHALRD